MPTLEPTLDDIQQASRELAALASAAREQPPTWQEVQAATAKLRANLSSLIEYVQELYKFAILVTAELSPSSAADSWKDLHEKFSAVLVMLERTIARQPLLEPETDSLFKHAIGVLRSIVDQADKEYRSYSETAYLFGSPANAERLQEAIAEAEGGRLKEMSLEAVRSLTGGAV